MRNIAGYMLVTVVFLVVGYPFCCQAHPEASHWTTFISRSGWSIRYPSTWSTSSCIACADPHAADVYVVFAPRRTSHRKEGIITITPLPNYALKPSGDTLQNLADDFAQTNRVQRINSQESLLAGKRALLVRYGHGNSPQIEVTFSSFHGEPIEIDFSGSGPLDLLPNFPAYKQMLSTFTYSAPI